jgi:hypothetical protein
MKPLVLSLMITGAAITEASPPPAPQFRVSVDKGIITLRAVNNGKILGKTTFERLGVIAPTQDELRHVASCGDDPRVLSLSLSGCRAEFDFKLK